MPTTIKLKNSVTTTNTPTSLAQGEVAINITDKKVWVGNAATTPIQLLGTGASINLTSLTTSNDCSISGLTVGKGGGAVSTNTAVGASALQSSNSGTGYNTAVGYQSAYSNTTGAYSTAIGYYAGYANTTGSITAVGSAALGANTTGSANTAVGGYDAVSGTNAALRYNTTGSYNTAVGTGALYDNTTASYNTAVGYQAGYSVTTGAQSVFVGYQAGNVTTGTENCFVGSSAGLNNTSGNYNTYVGRGLSTAAGYLMTTGSKNTIIGGYSGNQGGLDIRTSSNYIVLSDGDGNPRGIFDNSGNLLIGKVAPTSATVGCEMRPNGIMTCTRASGPPLSVNRTVDDGDLVSFQQDGTQEGSISVSGTTVSYNGGHLSRWSQLPDGSKDESIVKGTVMSNLDEMCVWEKDGVVAENEQLNKMKVSDVEGDTNVAGVFVNWTVDDAYGVDDMNVAMTGDMIIRIAQGVIVQKGDLLMSAGDGTAKPQGDDIRRSKTVAKVTSNHVTCTYEDGSYCVPCVLMAC